ncbi:TPA: hypothetical protein DHT42_00890 [Candidatus Nomurabacteria bacterium]|nr:MAG: hypothetical protein UV94_C0003G0006 [Parcubacteria group bacterium GW2011_GWC1_43_30]KKT80800.1 MAG: hypothetical protein UW76_C0005G0012 [Parcubacteria group bacterium GW2011_GWF2_44_8b]KKT85592.1 MAG: hypothetical protein UW83_C0013G0006 [Parcubacteria group bacterium GW2011_GWD1_44_9]HCY17745.1 hypothetical protein [Candidatus Nomurabacteria bacterium]
MNEDLNIIQSINQGADISINSKPTLDIVGSFDGGQNDWQSIPDSSFGSSDQVKFDNALYNNLDLISNNKLFERLKNYEQRFGFSSEEFYKNWIGGGLEPRQEFYDWASVYKNLLIHS